MSNRATWSYKLLLPTVRESPAAEQSCKTGQKCCRAAPVRLRSKQCTVCYHGIWLHLYQGVFTHLCNGKGIAVRLKFVLFTAVMSVCVHAFEFPQHANPCICLHARVRGLSLKKLHHKTRKPVILVPRLPTNFPSITTLTDTLLCFGFQSNKNVKDTCTTGSWIIFEWHLAKMKLITFISLCWQLYEVFCGI